MIDKLLGCVIHGTDATLLQHHKSSPPVVLKSSRHTDEPFIIWCTACDYIVTGSTFEAAISNWNDDIADPKGAP